MSSTKKVTLSNVSMRTVRKRSPSPQAIQTLEFIHRFRHVTTRHLQISFGHTSPTTQHYRLTQLCAADYLGRHYDTNDRAHNHVASYYITLAGVTLLQSVYPERRYRTKRSVASDATATNATRKRHQTLADVYVHFKRHYDGRFVFFSAFDIAKQPGMPEILPDGYIRFTMPDSKTQHYFVEIYGWGRSSHLQLRRLQSFVAFAENGTWDSGTSGEAPRFFAVAPGLSSRARLSNELSRLSDASFVPDIQMFTTIANRLDSSEPSIWYRVEAGNLG